MEEPMVAEECDTVSMEQGSHGIKNRLLFVDDEELNRKLIAALLRNSGVELTLAGNGKEAVELVQNEDFDLVLMDMKLPVMDGLEATRAIRELEKPGIEDLPILAVSAYDWEDIKGDCLAAGMNGCLGKPFLRDRIFPVLAKYLTIE